MVVVPAAPIEFVETYPSSTTAPSRARHRMVEVLHDCGAAAVADDAALMVSELVTNAVRHGAGEVTMHVGLAPDKLVVEVHDHGAEMPHLRTADLGGWGLHIVDRLSTRWGVKETGRAGKATWFELARR
jgi:anti-sigma regulatory factor (Ser/Thr protein kinase)